MDTNERHDDQRDEGRLSSTTSPPGGRPETATSPPKRGDLDEEALKKSREGLERAAGGD